MFYFVRQNLFEALDMIEVVGHTEVTGALLWTRGVRFDAPVPLQTLQLDPRYGGRFPDLFDTTVPLMSDRLIARLHATGISNFDVYPVRLAHPVTGEVRDDYSAINLVGRVDAVDRASSPHRLRFGKPMFTGSVVLDADRTEGLEAFRLVHGPDFIVVSERVAEQLRDGGFAGLLIQPTTQFTGT
jgi:hypothetical protein